MSNLGHWHECHKPQLCVGKHGKCIFIQSNGLCRNGLDPLVLKCVKTNMTGIGILEIRFLLAVFESRILVPVAGLATRLLLLCWPACELGLDVGRISPGHCICWHMQGSG